MATKNKVIVRIAGNEYTVMGVESEEYIQKVAFYIDKKMNEVLRGNSKLSTSMAAILTAINVADDFFKAHGNEINLSNELKQANIELERLRAENNRLAEENAALFDKNSNLQLELVKREAEVNEVRSSFEKAVRPKIHVNK